MHAPKRARARYVSRPRGVTTPNECPLTIGKLSDEVLLNIFRYYLDASPRLWPRLVHICHKWRQIVFASQQALRLRLFCRPGTPVLKTLDLWPALPIIVQYGGSLAYDPPAPEDEDNIMAALKQSARVSSIRLAITRSLREAIYSIEAPFSELEDLVLLSQDGVRLTLPNTFRWGPHLHRLHLTRIAFPGFPQLLCSSRNLVDLQLHDAFEALRLSPDALADALSGMIQLRALSLHFPPIASFVGATSSPRGRVVLPAITRLDFRGMSEYFEGLVVRMYAPRLEDIEITFFDELISDVPNLRNFINRIKMQKSHSRADVLFSGHTISISFTQPGAPTCSELRIFHGPLNRKLPSMIEICNRLATFLSGVEDLRVHALSSGQDKHNMDSEKWAKLIHPFKGTKWFHIAGDLSTDIVLSLQLSGKRRGTLLPALHKLYIHEPGPRYAPLREAVVSLMMSRRLSGRHIEVEYERLWVSELRGTVGPVSQQVTIEMLSDDVLLNIFRHYLYAFPQLWPTLMHVDSRWRRTVLRSPLGLHLRLYCTYGTPVLKTLECWPPFPLVVNYGGSPRSNPPVPEDEENIMAALEQSDRVASISLTVTNSLLGNLSTISEPFTELEELVLLSRDNAQLTFPSAFQSGARLRTLQLTRIAIPTLPQLLSPSTGIVDLQLHEIPNVGYFSPEVFANALSLMTQLETLSLHFLSFPPRREYLNSPPPPEERIVLPALTCLQYRGTSKYLDNFVARIDAPRLEDIGITFFSQPTMDASQLGRFIERVEMQTPLSRADVQTSAHAISISFSNPGAPTKLDLQISCEQLDWQLSSMTQIRDHFSSFLPRIENLGIFMAQCSTVQDNMNEQQWVEFIRAFGDIEEFRVVGELAVDILRTLCPVDGGPIMLPSLRTLGLPELMQTHGPLWDAAQSFFTSRQLSDCPVELRIVCHVCNTSFVRPRDLQRHLVDKHVHASIPEKKGPAQIMSHIAIPLPQYPLSLYQERRRQQQNHPAQTQVTVPTKRTFRRIDPMELRLMREVTRAQAQAGGRRTP